MPTPGSERNGCGVGEHENALTVSAGTETSVIETGQRRERAAPADDQVQVALRIQELERNRSCIGRNIVSEVLRQQVAGMNGVERHAIGQGDEVKIHPQGGGNVIRPRVLQPEVIAHAGGQWRQPVRIQRVKSLRCLRKQSNIAGVGAGRRPVLVEQHVHGPGRLNKQIRRPRSPVGRLDGKRSHLPGRHGVGARDPGRQLNRHGLGVLKNNAQLPTGQFRRGQTSSGARIPHFQLPGAAGVFADQGAERLLGPAVEIPTGVVG